MKKIVLSLSALFAVSLASAQSYPKQPDKTVVEYVNYYQKPAENPKEEVKQEEVQNADKKTEKQPAVKKEDNKIEKATNPAILNSNRKSVAVTERAEK
jgi:hypothetical protein